MAYVIAVVVVVALVVGVIGYDRYRTKKDAAIRAAGGRVSGPVSGNQHSDMATNYDAVNRSSEGTRNQTGGMGTL